MQRCLHKRDCINKKNRGGVVRGEFADEGILRRVFVIGRALSVDRLIEKSKLLFICLIIIFFESQLLVDYADC